MNLLKHVKDHLKAFPSLGLLIIFLLVNVNTQALAKSTDLQGNKVQFSVTESQEVPNDRVSITFNRIAEGATPQDVANEINTQMQSALKALKSHPEVIVQTSQYNINPVYKKQIISHWRGQQSLIITLTNNPGLAKVLAKVQPYLAYQSMRFGVSDHAKQKILEKLTDKAIASFRKQANRIAQGFQAPSYKILATQINMPNFAPTRELYAHADMAMVSSKMAAPAVSAGQSKLNITVSGTILLAYQ